MDQLSKIERLKQKFAAADAANLATIAGWEEQVKQALIVADLGKHQAIRDFLAHLEEDIRDMRSLLESADSSQLPDKQRDRVLDRKALYERFANLFHIAQSNLDATMKEIEDNLSQ